MRTSVSLSRSPQLYGNVANSGNSAARGGGKIAQMPGSNLAARHYIYDVRGKPLLCIQYNSFSLSLQ